MKRIHIVTTTFNDAHKYLMETMESVKNQKLIDKNIELKHTIVDDGTDNEESLKQLEIIKKKFDVSIIRQANQGLAGARNTGILNYDSDFVFPLDSDDLISADFFQKIGELILNNDFKNSLIFTNWKSFGKYKRNMKVKLPTAYTIRYANYLPVSSLIPTEILTKYKYDRQMNLGFEDWELWIRLICGGIKLSHLEFYGFFHREQKNNLTSKAFLNFKKNYEYIRSKNKEFYTNEYETWSKNNFPPDLVDYLKISIDPRYKFFIIQNLLILKNIFNFQ